MIQVKARNYPRIMEAIARKARAEGVTPTLWVIRALSKAVGVPPPCGHRGPAGVSCARDLGHENEDRKDARVHMTLDHKTTWESKQ